MFEYDSGGWGRQGRAGEGSGGSGRRRSEQRQQSRCVFFVLCALWLLPLALSLKPQWHKDFLRWREGQTTHYGLRKNLRCAASKTTLFAFFDSANTICK
jgi:hypothetical protein